MQKKLRRLFGSLVIVGLILAMGFINAPLAKAQPAVTGFFLSEVAYNGNANVSDRFVNDEGYMRLNGSVYSDSGVPQVTARIWHTVGNCLPGVVGACQPGNLKVAEFNVPVTAATLPGYYTFSSVPISGIIKPFTDGSWVSQIEVLDPTSTKTESLGISDYAWFWLETRSPNVPELVTPINDLAQEEGNIVFDWKDTEDFLPPSGLRSGLQKYNFELYSDSDLANLVYQSSLGVSESTVTVSGLMNGSYYWRVCALDNVGNYSSWSSTWAFFIEKGDQPVEEPPTPQGEEEEDTDDEKEDSSDSDIDGPILPPSDTTSGGTIGGVINSAPLPTDETSDITTRAGNLFRAIAGDQNEDSEEEPVGEVMGVAEAAGEGECQDENFAWWLPLLIAALVSLILGILVKRGKRYWLFVPIVIALVAQLINWFWLVCNCATSGWCNWYWLFNLIILILGLIYFGLRTRSKDFEDNL